MNVKRGCSRYTTTGGGGALLMKMLKPTLLRAKAGTANVRVSSPRTARMIFFILAPPLLRGEMEDRCVSSLTLRRTAIQQYWTPRTKGRLPAEPYHDEFLTGTQSAFQ